MRRTPLRRGKPIARRAAKRKRYRDAAVMQDHADRHESCACCWKHSRQFGVRIQIHHILPGRKSRVDASWNVISLCSEMDGTGCHERLQHGRENLAIVMRLKREAGGYDRVAMAAWMKRFTNGYGGELLPRMAASYPNWITNARETWSDR